MTTVSDAELFANADRVKGKVVLITGGANGIGRVTALCFAKYGAKVVIGDLDMVKAEEVVAEIKSMGSDAVARACDVTSWEQQLDLFQFALSKYHQIDIVIPNAGVTERGALTAVRATAANGVPTKPNLKTLQVNLIAVVYTTRLALFYLLENSVEDPGALKAIVYVGSMSSILSIPKAPLYSTSKHGIIGLMRSVHFEYQDTIRVGVVCPWFADTAIIATPLKLFMAGIPLTPLSRIGGAIFKAATDVDPETNGAAYTLPDHGETFRLNDSQLFLNEGVYKMLNERTKFVVGIVSRSLHFVTILTDVFKILGPKLLSWGLGAAVAIFAWNYSPYLRDYIFKA